MKNKTAGIVCILVLVGAWVYAHTQTPASSSLSTGANGRYQVVAAEIDYKNMGGTLGHKTAIRIDTQTGKTWELTEIDNDKGAGGGFYWVPSNDVK